MTKIKRGPVAADNFTILPNSQVRDESLSWGARGLLGWLHSHQEGFEITEETIVAAGKSGRDGIRTMLRELESGGYLVRERTPVITGGSTVDYVLTDPRASDRTTLGNVGSDHPRADQEQLDLFPGQPTDGSANPRSYTEDQKKTKTPSVSRPKLATRVPEDFYPDEAMTAWFVAEQLGSVVNGKSEHEKFMDYWRAKPGADGRKLDWAATWRIWMRKAAEYAGRRPGNSVVAYGGAGVPKASTTDQRIAQGNALAAKYREQGL